MPSRAENQTSLKTIGNLHPRQTNQCLTCGKVRPFSPLQTMRSKTKNQVQDLQHAGSSIRRAGRIVPDEPTSLPLALGRIHQRLSKPEELKKLHLLPKSTECEVCQAAKQAPSKTSGPRADTFGDMTDIDHCEVPGETGEHIIVFVTTQEAENIAVLRNYLDQLTETWEHFYQSLDITPISLGPNTPWPNRAEAAVRLLKTQDHAQLYQGRRSTCNTQESGTQTTFEGSRNCQKSDHHL